MTPSRRDSSEPSGPTPTPPRIEWMARWSPSEQILRLARVNWQGGRTRRGVPALSTLSVGLRPAVFRYWRDDDEFSVTLLGLRLHLRRLSAEPRA